MIKTIVIVRKCGKNGLMLKNRNDGYIHCLMNSGYIHFQNFQKQYLIGKMTYKYPSLLLFKSDQF